MTTRDILTAGSEPLFTLQVGGVLQEEQYIISPSNTLLLPLEYLSAGVSGEIHLVAVTVGDLPLTAAQQTLTLRDNISGRQFAATPLTIALVHPPSVSLSVRVLSSLLAARFDTPLAVLSIDGGNGRGYSLFVTSAIDVRIDKATLRALANAPGVFLITISGDDDHPATPAASITLTVSAVAELVMQQIPVLTMTTRITSLINAAAVLSAVGGFAPYQYYLANKPAYLSVNIDSGAVDILRGADAPDTLVLQARGEDDSDPRLTAFVSLTVVVVDPPSLRIRLLSPDFLAPVAQRATLGSLIVEGGFTLTAYNFVANGDDVFVSVDADGLVLLSAAQTGLYLLTLIVADNHPLVDNATLKITARVSPSFELPPPTVIFTITTRAGTSPQRTTLQAVRGFAPIRYGIAGAASAFMSIDAASGELGHFGIAPSLAATITGTVFAADSSRPRLTAVVLFTVEVVEPQPLSAEIEVGALTLSVGGVASIATLSASTETKTSSFATMIIIMACDY